MIDAIDELIEYRGAYGNGPDNTYSEMAHGKGGGCYSVDCFVPGAGKLWERAAYE